MSPQTSARVEQAGGRAAAGGLLLLSGLAWVAVLLGPDGMHDGAAAFLAAWTVMMVAMMLPSAAPLVLLYGKGEPAARTASLTAGYLLVWAAAGVPALLAQELLPMAAAPLALAAAGVYQLTPLKSACLARCRSPADFLVQRWGRGALRLGIEHGVWCLGCCWALMAVLVLVGGMGLAWVVGVASLVAVEKLAPRGIWWSRSTGFALLLAASIQGVLWLTGG